MTCLYCHGDAHPPEECPNVRDLAHGPRSRHADIGAGFVALVRVEEPREVAVVDCGCLTWATRLPGRLTKLTRVLRPCGKGLSCFNAANLVHRTWLEGCPILLQPPSEYAVHETPTPP